MNIDSEFYKLISKTFGSLYEVKTSNYHQLHHVWYYEDTSDDYLFDIEYARREICISQRKISQPLMTCFDLPHNVMPSLLKELFKEHFEIDATITVVDTLG